MFQAVTVNNAVVNGIVTNWLLSLFNASKFTVAIKILYTVCIVFFALIQPQLYLVVTTHPKWTNITNKSINSLPNELINFMTRRLSQLNNYSTDQYILSIQRTLTCTKTSLDSLCRSCTNVVKFTQHLHSFIEGTIIFHTSIYIYISQSP
jgi:hypothetical protein